MPKLPVVSGKELLSVLAKAGFVISALGHTPAFRPAIWPKCCFTCPCGDTPGL